MLSFSTPSPFPAILLQSIMHSNATFLLFLISSFESAVSSSTMPIQTTPALTLTQTQLQKIQQQHQQLDSLSNAILTETACTVGFLMG